jgi:toxin FitB
MTYLLDTNVLSETRKRQPAVGVAEWIAATPPDRMHISVLTLGEIEQGIARIRGRGDQDQAAALERWLTDVQAGFEDRILPVSLPVATAWGRQPQTQPVPVIDALIAATARVHGLTMVTRNAKDFEPAGIPVLNPFAGRGEPR